MDEERLRELLSREIRTPDLVNRKLQKTYARLAAQPARRGGLRAARTLLIAAALAAALCMTAVAACIALRQEVPVDEPAAVDGLLGGGLPSWQNNTGYDSNGDPYRLPVRQTVPVDLDQALTLVGAYLPACGYQWQIGEYTLTIESYLLDEHTGTAKFYYTVEHPGGFGEDAVYWDNGRLDWQTYPVMEQFFGAADPDKLCLSGRRYLDTARSTPEKLYIVQGCACSEDWKAQDGIAIVFAEFANPGSEEGAAYTELALPGLQSLPAREAADAVSGKTLVFSAIGIRLPCEDIDRVDTVVLEYTDGTEYLVTDDAARLCNEDYALGSGEQPEMTLQLVFNRLVDPAQVAAVRVDGTRYVAAEQG